MTKIIITLLILVLEANLTLANNQQLTNGLSTTEWDSINQLITSSNFQQQAYIKASNTGENDVFGVDVALYGDTLVVGAPFESSDATGVNGDENNDLTYRSGAVYVFIKNNGLWAQQAYLKASNGDANDRFGISVAIFEDTLVVGASREGSNTTVVNGDELNNLANFSGAAYVFIRSNGIWAQQSYIKASNSEFGDSFGESVSISADTIVVGARLEDSNETVVDGDESDNSADSAGAAYVFVRNGDIWSQQAYLKASNTDGGIIYPEATITGDLFGSKVVISGDTIAVSAIFEDSNTTGVNSDELSNNAYNSGAVYIFTRTNDNWTQQAYIKASNTGGGIAGVYTPGFLTNSENGDLFGLSLDLQGNTLVVGSQDSSEATSVNGDQTNNLAFKSGAVYVFKRVNNQWAQQAFIKSSNSDGGSVGYYYDDNYERGTPGDLFGSSVAIYNDTLVVGASGEDSNTIGINGNEDDNSALSSGAIYEFKRTNNNWHQQTYIKASNTGEGDLFGSHLCLYNQKIVVGAFFEDSNATGIEGDQQDNSSWASGAVYIFEDDVIFANGFE